MGSSPAATATGRLRKKALLQRRQAKLEDAGIHDLFDMSDVAPPPEPANRGFQIRSRPPYRLPRCPAARVAAARSAGRLRSREFAG